MKSVIGERGSVRAKAAGDYKRNVYALLCMRKAPGKRAARTRDVSGNAYDRGRSTAPVQSCADIGPTIYTASYGIHGSLSGTLLLFATLLGSRREVSAN